MKNEIIKILEEQIPFFIQSLSYEIREKEDNIGFNYYFEENTFLNIEIDIYNLHIRQKVDIFIFSQTKDKTLFFEALLGDLQKKVITDIILIGVDSIKENE